MKEAQTATGKLKSENVSIELIDLRTIYPYDAETVLESVKKTGRLLVVHEGPQSFGVAAELISLVSNQAFEYLEAPPTRLTGADTIFPLPTGEHHYMITTDHIITETKSVIRYEP